MWATIRDALEDNGRAWRLVIIILTMSVAAVITGAGTLLAAEAVRAWLG